MTRMISMEEAHKYVPLSARASLKTALRTAKQGTIDCKTRVSIMCSLHFPGASGLSIHDATCQLWSAELERREIKLWRLRNWQSLMIDTTYRSKRRNWEVSTVIQRNQVMYSRWIRSYMVDASWLIFDNALQRARRASAWWLVVNQWTTNLSMHALINAWWRYRFIRLCHKITEWFNGLGWYLVPWWYQVPYTTYRVPGTR